MNLIKFCQIDFVNLIYTEVVNQLLLCELVTYLLFILFEFITRIV